MSALKNFDPRPKGEGNDSEKDAVLTFFKWFKIHFWKKSTWHPSNMDPDPDPLSNFIKELDGLCSVPDPDIAALVSDLPVPQDGDVGGMSLEGAVQVCLYMTEYSTVYHILHHM